MPSPVEAFEPQFMRLALVEVVLLAVAAGLLGAFVVLRRLAFFTHAAGNATFPGLVAAEAAGVNAQLAALALALGYAGGVERAGRDGRQASDPLTALLLVAALAAGAVLASDVLESGAGVDRLLFGTLIGLGGSDLAAAALVALLAAIATAALGRSWVAAEFDAEAHRAQAAPRGDAVLLALLAAAVVSALPAVGALLVASMLVVPAATARLLTRSVPALVAAATALAVGTGMVGLYAAYWLDAPPGPAIALLAAALYAAVAIVRRVA